MSKKKIFENLKPHSFEFDSLRSETSVEVKAQVMKRGDAGWVPIDGGGLSVVGLSTFPVDDNLEEVQYRVNARRVKDNAVSCRHRVVV